MSGESVYAKLHNKLDVTPTGAPKGERFLEILKVLFTPEEAELALIVPFMPAGLPDIAAAAEMDEESALSILSNMADKGLLYSFVLKDTPMFMLFSVVWTIFKFPFNTNVPGVDYERLRALCSEYLAEESFLERSCLEEGKHVPMGRVLPVEESLPIESEVLPQDIVYSYIDEARHISVANCSCKMIVGGCDSPREVCMAFDHEAKYLVERKMARFISREEARDIHRIATESGLVSVTSNTKRKVNLICHCCPCCCAQLGVATRHGLYELSPKGTYIASVNQDACTACGLCEETCPMQALEVAETAKVIAGRCIGCGLCVSSCADGAIYLEKRKPEPDVPEDIMEWTRAAVQARGVAQDFVKELKVGGEGE